MNSRPVLSIFPGADLLGRGFEAEGFCVVRGPDTVWGSNIRDFHPSRGAFLGVIGGSPCPDFSRARRTPPTGDGEAMLREWVRCVLEAGPDWALLENVPGVPDIAPFFAEAGRTLQPWQCQRFHLSARECGGRQHRLRAFQFVHFDHSGVLLLARPALGRGGERTCVAREAKQPGRRSFADFCELQGLPRSFDLPGLSLAAKYRAVGNGVPVFMARFVARAIKARDALCELRLCVCGCGRPVHGPAGQATATCRKRMQRRRDAARVQSPSSGTAAAVTRARLLQPGEARPGVTECAAAGAGGSRA